ncbi:MAG: YlmH/Sll1252 family protein [Ruminococcus sp.]|nr:YlmH/Sll1252 family protein [Ruminococcus sp.]
MAGTGEKELQQLKKRLLELADKSYSRGIYTYTSFLGLAEQQVFYEIEKEVAYAGVGLEGGAPACERKMIRFGSVENLGYEEEYPIACLEMAPVTPKFADTLTHRDFLGTIMNHGIERDTIGDIFVRDGGGILFCKQSIAPYLLENLTQVKHTSIRCRILEDTVSLQSAEPEEISLTVSSARIDSVIAKIYHMSRSRSLELFSAGKIYVNGIATENVSYQLKKDDAVTVRGYGKFIFYGMTSETRKGRERISVGIYKS